MSERTEQDPVRLDTRGLLCPMPVIRTGEAVDQVEPGTEIEIRASDPGALHDIPAWCRVNGHTFLDAREEGDEIVLRIRVGG